MKLKFHNAALNQPRESGTYFCYSDLHNEFYIADAYVFANGGVDWSYKPSYSLISDHASMLVHKASEIIVKEKMENEGFNGAQKNAIDWAIKEIDKIVNYELYDLYQPFEIDTIAPDPDWYCLLDESVLFSDLFEIDEFEIHTDSIALAEDIQNAVFGIISRAHKSRDLAKSQPWRK